MGGPNLSIVRTTPHQRIAELWADALEDEGIAAAVAPASSGWSVVVDFEASERAAIVLAEIDAEDPDSDAPTGPEEDDALPPRVAPLPGWGRSWAGAVVAWVLVGAWGVTGAADPGTRAFERGANAAALTRAEPWRACTSLFLHADLAHLAGNVGALFVFVTFVAWRLGPGAAAAVVLLSAIAGNLLSAWINGAGVISVGASTAAFSALGVLAALAISDPARRRSIVVVLLASAALLGMLGTSPGADVMAHVTGWLCGLVLGLPAAWAWRTPPRRATQTALAILAIALPALSWSLALR